jgi:hypothetical protein
MTEGLRQTGRETAVDPALVEAWCELGYVVMEDNRHLFSAGDILAWRAAVRRHADDFGGEATSTARTRSTGTARRNEIYALSRSSIRNAETTSAERSRAKAWQRLSVGGFRPNDRLTPWVPAVRR